MVLNTPIESNDNLTKKELQSAAFINQVIADFEALRSVPVAWEQYCDDFEAIDGIRPK